MPAQKKPSFGMMTVPSPAKRGKDPGIVTPARGVKQAVDPAIRQYRAPGPRRFQVDTMVGGKPKAVRGITKQGRV